MGRALGYALGASALLLGAISLLNAPEAPPREVLSEPAPAPPPRVSQAFVNVPTLTHTPRQRALLLGDSNIFGPLGKSLERSLGALGFDVARYGKPTSGLARPDFYDWPERARELLSTHEPHLVIAMFGGNDGQRMEFKDASGVPIKMPGGEAWAQAYGERVREFALLLRGEERRVFILSPTNRRPRFAREKMMRVKGAQRQALSGLERVTWIDMFPLSSDAEGRWLALGPDINGDPVRYRREDGIHLTPAGGQLVGERLLERLFEQGLTTCSGAR